MKKKTKMKTKNIIQRLCLFLFVLVLAAPAWATDYGRLDYETFRSRNTVKAVGKKKPVRTLRQGRVEIKFSDCKTTSGTGNRAIYELAKGSYFSVEVDDGYAIRWIILRDTEGGKDYDHKDGIKRISSVTSGYSHYFERNAISNSYISGANQNNLNDDDNNIVVQQYDATAQNVVIYTHNRSNWDQFKVRDIIVGYVKIPDGSFGKSSYDVYTVSGLFRPDLNMKGYYGGTIGYKLDNNNIAELYVYGDLKLKHPGTVVLTATFPSNAKFAKKECSTKINVMRDKVTFNNKNDINPLPCDYERDIFSLIGYKTASGIIYTDHGGYSVTSSNPAVLSYNYGKLRCGSKAGEATITIKQVQNDYYEEASFSQTFYVMRRDQDGTVLIKDADEWKLFCKLVNENGMTKLNARLETDVNLGSDIAMVGTTSHPYTGTFDGQNHTLTLNWNTDKNDIAPFRRVGGATIKNLCTAGTIKSSSYFLAGLIDEASGDNNTISGCVSNVDITSSYTSERCGAGGLISYIYENTRVAITDCFVKGSINGSGAGRRGMGGFVYGQNGTCTLTNCLYAGTNNVENNGERTNTFANKATIDNCYYLNPCGSEYKQGTKVTEEQIRSGEVAYQLQKGRSDMVWGQKIGTDNTPLLTGNHSKRVRKVDFTYNNQVKATRYATNGNAIYGSLPTLQDFVGSSYNEHHYYTRPTFAEGFNENTTVTFDKRVAVSITEKDAYEIGSVANWKEFCNIVSGGQNAVDAKMIADVNLGSEIAMVGTSNNPYRGTFDGQNHTLTVNWNAENSEVAPFRHVNGTTIRNLRTEGTIKSSHMYIGGLIDEAYGENTVTGCISNVNLTSTYADNRCGAGGLISYIGNNARVTITDCLVKGSINATTDIGKTGMGGFVYGQHGTCILNNCLYIGTNNAKSTPGIYTFAENATVTNCYYLNACGTAQGTQITKEQLNGGAVAYLLQNKRDDQVWGQELGKDDEPRLTDIVTKYIYKVGFVYKGKEKASRYANRGKAIFGGMPTAQDILGTLYDPAKNYTLIFEYGFNTVTDVYKDRTVAVSILANNNFDIATKDDWKEFRELVNDGHRNFDAKMTADVDLDRDIVIVGNDIDKYSGTFDGQGHTLTVNWNQTHYSIAPFGGVNGATIKNLHVKGKITASGGNLSGLILFADGGKTSVSGCVIDMDLKGSSDVPGMIYKVYSGAQVTITDCVVKGALNSTSTGQIAGFVNYQDYNSSCTFTNCLYAGTNNATPGSYTFANRANLNNCYYLNPCGKVQGDRVTAEQLKSGEVAKMLQAGRTDQCYWAQALGEEPSPYREADKAKANYVYYNKVNNSWTCDDFRLTDGHALPIGIDFIATKATYERDLSAAAKATICLPYELPANGFKAYTLSGGDNSAVHFAEAKDKLEAYKPYLITADGVPQLGGENIEVKAFNDDKLTTPAGKYKFVGTVSGMDNASATAANAYILQEDGKFHKVTTEHSEAMLPAYRAYIQRNDSGAKQLSIVIDGETTGIGGATNGRADGPVYDLQGRRVADRLDDAARHRLPAGVYIVGGRKVVVK